MTGSNHDHLFVATGCGAGDEGDTRLFVFVLRVPSLLLLPSMSTSSRDKKQPQKRKQKQKPKRTSGSDRALRLTKLPFARRSVPAPVPADGCRVVLASRGARVRYWPLALDAEQQERLTAELELHKHRWTQRWLPGMFGHPPTLSKRLMGAVADVGVSYSFGGVHLSGEGWDEFPELTALRLRVVALSGESLPPNYVLINKYRDGKDEVGPHHDKNTRGTTVLSVSLGAVRDFCIQADADKSEKYRVTLASGSLLTMEGEMQRHYKHSLPKCAAVQTWRYNLTMRYMPTN